MSGPEHRAFKALRDDEGVDEIRLRIIPRFKTSDLSGNEWRTSAKIELYRKGVLVGEQTYGTLEAATMALPWLWCNRVEATGPVALWGLDDVQCNQPSCSEPAVVIYRIKEEFSRQGEGPLQPSGIAWHRAFCVKHSERGDCSREDSDDNYVTL